MARYIDADKLSEMIQHKADTLIASKEAFLYVAGWLNFLPAADVVPRAEVEKAKEEIARKIFDAIEAALFIYEREHSAFGSSEYVKYFDISLRDEIETFKKKYLPGGEDDEGEG